MKYTEEVRDLFSVPEEYYLAHCISADFGMGKGIVVEFNKRFDMKRKLKSKYPKYLSDFSQMSITGDCILEGRVLNLVTKERYFHKPTYKSLTIALRAMKQICMDCGISKVAMPMIGSGLDSLEWRKVSQIIQEVFADSNLEILICRLK